MNSGEVNSEPLRNGAARNYWFFTLAIAVTALLAMKHQPSHDFEVRNISVAEARAMVNAGAVVVDVRDEEKFSSRHLKGAISLPVAVLRQGIPTTFSYAKDRPILVYCGDGVTTGPEGTQLLNDAGYSNAVNLEAGIAGWADAGLPVWLPAKP